MCFPDFIHFEIMVKMNKKNQSANIKEQQPVGIFQIRNALDYFGSFGRFVAGKTRTI